MRVRIAAIGRLLVAVVLVLPLAAVPLTAAATEVQRVIADDGLEAWLVEDRSTPSIVLSAAFRGGAALDPPPLLGLAAMTMALLGEGAGDLDAAAFQARLEAIAADIGFGAGQDALTVSLRSLSAHREQAFALLALALRQPRFDADAVERVRDQRLAWLRRQAKDPEAVASRRFFATLFPDHPYGRPVDGTEETIARIGGDEIRAFAAQRLGRSALVIGVAGDITAAELVPLLRQTFGPLPAAAAPAEIAPAAATARGQTVIVEMPVRQSVVMFGQPGVVRSDPRFEALALVNQILGGGGLTSRLFAEVREKRGLAYAVSTQLLALQQGGLWLGQAATTNERVAETLAVIREEWQRLRAEGVTGEELADAKAYLIGSFPLRLTSNRRLAEMLVAMQLQDLGIDWLSRRNRLIENVTLEEANGAAAAVTDPSALTVVVVGQPEDIDDPR